MTSRHREKKDWSIQNNQRKNQSMSPWSADRSNKKKCTSGANREAGAPLDDRKTRESGPRSSRIKYPRQIDSGLAKGITSSWKTMLDA